MSEMDAAGASHADEVRAAYDEVAVDYAELLHGHLGGQPIDRMVLQRFVESVEPGEVADIGCGPGRITDHLASLGVDVFGIDLSPGMVRVARQAHPELRFEVGSMLALDEPGAALADASIAGAVCWYSLIHIAPSDRPRAFAELRRVLPAGGLLLAAFQVGDDVEVRHEHVYGHDVAFSGWRMSVDAVLAELADAGFALEWRLVRAPEPPERSEQGYLLARAV